MPQNDEITALLNYFQERDAKQEEVRQIQETQQKQQQAQQQQQAALQGMGTSLFSIGKSIGGIIEGGNAERKKLLEEYQRANDLQRARIERESGPGSAGGYEAGHLPEENLADWLAKIYQLGEAGVNLYQQGKPYISALKSVQAKKSDTATALLEENSQQKTDNSQQVVANCRGGRLKLIPRTV